MEGPPSAERPCALCNSKDRRADVVCTRCKRAHYCSVECRNRDWDGNSHASRGWHALICPLIRGRKYERLSGIVGDTVVYALKESAELLMDQLRVLKREFCSAHPKEKPVLLLTFDYDIEEVLNAAALVSSMKTWIESTVIKETQRALKAQGRSLISDEAEQFLNGVFGNPRLSMRVTDEAGTNAPPLTRASEFYSAWRDKDNLACVTWTHLVGGQGASMSRSILVVKDVISIEPSPPPPSGSAAAKARPSNPRVGLLLSPSGFVKQTPPLDEEQEGSFAHYMGVEEACGVRLGGIEGHALVAFFDANWETKKLPLNKTASYLGQTKEDNVYGDVLLVDEGRDLEVADLERIIKAVQASRKAVRAATKGAVLP